MAGEFLGVRLEQGGLTLTISTAGTLDNYGAENVKSGGSIDVESGGGIDIESGGDIDIESGGHIDVDSGGYVDFGSGGYFKVTPTTAAGAQSVPSLGVTKMIPVSTGNNYTLATAQPGTYHVAVAPTGPSTGQEAYVDSTAAQFLIGGSTASTGLILGSTASTGNMQFALLFAVSSTEWLVVAKTSGIVGT
jgi:hypothetical protein